MGCGASSNPSDGGIPQPLSKVIETLADRVEAAPSTVSPVDAEHLQRIRRYISDHNRRHPPVDARYSALEESLQISPAPGAVLEDKPGASAVLRTWHEATAHTGMIDIGERIVEDVLHRRPSTAVAFATITPSQRGTVMARMVNVVAKTDMTNPAFVPTLLNLGARHMSYGLDPELLTDVREATMRVLEAVHGHLTKDDLGAWDTVWETTIKLMTHGMSSELGRINAQRFEAQTARDVQSLWQRIRLAQADAEETLFTRCMYKRVLEENPSLSRFSNLSDFRTAERVMAMLTMVVDNRAEGRDNEAMMRESGARHVAYGVTVGDMMAFLPAFLEACQYYLQGEYTAAARYQLEGLWLYVVRGFEVGLVGEAGTGVRRAPHGDEGGVAMVFTDIEKSTRLWEANPAVMSQALDKHNNLLRQLIREYRGYEVKTIGDSFMVAFENMVDAVLFSCSVQTELHRRGPIAEGFTMVKGAQGQGPSSVWNQHTLRVRVGIEWCQHFAVQYDSVHRRYDYHGPSINLAERVESNAAGGQVLLTHHALAELQGHPEYHTTAAPPEFERLAASTNAVKGTLADALSVTLVATDVKLNGVVDGIDLYSVLPTSLSSRKFDTSSRIKAFLEFRPTVSVNHSTDARSVSAHSCDTNPHSG